MNAHAPTLRIVIADDHALVRGGLVLVIKMLTEDIEVSETNDLEQTLECLNKQQPVDLLLLDLLMPGMNGTEGIRTICGTWPDIPVVVVSVREDSASIRQALEAGAVGYIPKTSSPKVTMSAVQFVLAGGIYVPPHVLRGGAEGLPEESTGPTADLYGAVEKTTDKLLTRRQKEVFELMSIGKSNKAIASELGLTPGTVKMHISRIFKILNVENRTEAVTKFSQLLGPNTTMP